MDKQGPHLDKPVRGVGEGGRQGHDMEQNRAGSPHSRGRRGWRTRCCLAARGQGGDPTQHRGHAIRPPVGTSGCVQVGDSDRTDPELAEQIHRDHYQGYKRNWAI